MTQLWTLQQRQNNDNDYTACCKQNNKRITCFGEPVDFRRFSSACTKLRAVSRRTKGSRACKQNIVLWTIQENMHDTVCSLQNQTRRVCLGKNDGALEVTASACMTIWNVPLNESSPAVHAVPIRQSLRSASRESHFPGACPFSSTCLRHYSCAKLVPDSSVSSQIRSLSRRYLYLAKMLVLSQQEIDDSAFLWLDFCLKFLKMYEMGFEGLVEGRWFLFEKARTQQWDVCGQQL